MATIEELKHVLDDVVEKKLNQSESKIRENSTKIAKLLDEQDRLSRALNRSRMAGDDLPLSGGVDPQAARGFAACCLAAGGSRKHAEMLRSDFGAELKGQTEGDQTYGGVLVPDVVAREVIRLVNRYGVLRRNALVVPLSSGGENTWPKRNTGLTVYAPGEAKAITESQMTFGSVKLTPKKWATLTSISTELAEDALADIGAILVDEIAYVFANKEDDCGFNGTGAQATYFGITGLLNAAAAGAVKTTASDDWADITIANILQYPAYLADYADEGPGEIKWFMNRTPYFAGFVDAMLGQGGSTAEEVRSNAIAGAGNRTILGYPVELTNALPGTDAAASTPFGVLGNLKKCMLIGDRRDLNIVKSNEVYFTTDQIGIRATRRVDIVVHDVGTASAAGSYVVLKTGSAD